MAAEKKAQQLEIFTDVLGHMLNTVQKSCVQFTCQIGGIRKALQAGDHEFDQVKEMTKTLQRTETAAKEQIFKCRRLVEKNYAHFETTLRGRQKQGDRVQRVRQWKDMRKKAEDSRSKMEINRILPLSVGIALKIGSKAKSGSPGKYICVTSRGKKLRPNTEKCTCAGRHAL